MEIYRVDNSWIVLRDKLHPSEGKSVIKSAENVPSTSLVTKKRKSSQSSSKSNAKKAKTASTKVYKYVRRGKKIQEEPKEMQEELPITPQEPKVPASELADVTDVKKDVKQHRGTENLDEVSTILSARRAKIAARKKFIRTELAPSPTSQPDKVTVDEKKDDKRPRLETSTETPKIRFKVKGRKNFWSSIVSLNLFCILVFSCSIHCVPVLSIADCENSGLFKFRYAAVL